MSRDYGYVFGNLKLPEQDVGRLSLGNVTNIYIYIYIKDVCESYVRPTVLYLSET